MKKNGLKLVQTEDKKKLLVVKDRVPRGSPGGTYPADYDGT